MEESTPESNPQEAPAARDQARYSSASPAEFSIGSVLSRTFNTLFKNPVLFFGLAVIAAIPGFLVEMVTDDSSIGSVLLSLVGAFFGVIFQGAIAYGVYRSLRGEQASIGDSISHGMARFIPLLIAAIILGLGIGIGTMLLIVPGLILMCVWAVTIPACVVEKLGATDSLKRSAELTKGYRWKIFGLVVLLAVITGVLVSVMAYLLTSISDSMLVAGLGVAIVSLIPSAFQNVMMSTVYYDLRAIKEGVTVDNLINVFD